MLKRIISLLLVVSLCTLAIPAFADAPVQNTFSAPEKIVGRLISDTGEIEEVMGRRIDTPAPLSNAADTQSATYEVTLYSTANKTLTANQTDGSISVRAYLTIYFTARSEPASMEEILLTAVSGYWEILDPKARVESTSLEYGCAGVPNDASWQHNITSVDNPFHINTGYSVYVINNGTAAFGATWTLNMIMGTSRRWSMQIDNKI